MAVPNVRVITSNTDGAYAAAGGYVRGGNGQTKPLAVDLAGNVRLGDEDIERIAQAVVRLLNLQGASSEASNDAPSEELFHVARNRPRPDLDIG